MTKKTLRRLNVLVVDDDHAIVRLLDKVLGSHFEDEITLETMTDPIEASQWLETHCCDILLSDIEMPGLDGLAVCRSLRALPGLARLPVIVLSARAQESDIVAGLASGADRYITKPFDPADLISVIDHLLARDTE